MLREVRKLNINNSSNKAQNQSNIANSRPGHTDLMYPPGGQVINQSNHIYHDIKGLHHGIPQSTNQFNSLPVVLQQSMASNPTYYAADNQNIEAMNLQHQRLQSHHINNEELIQSRPQFLHPSQVAPQGIINRHVKQARQNVVAFSGKSKLPVADQDVSLDSGNAQFTSAANIYHSTPLHSHHSNIPVMKAGKMRIDPLMKDTF